MDNHDFKIIRIISDTEFIVDAGSNDGVKNGDKFQVLDPDANPIIDMDDNLIGYYGAQKEILTVIDVHDTFSILKTRFVEATSNKETSIQRVMKSSAFGVPFVTASMRSDVPAHYKRANIDPSEMEPLEKSNAPIKKGDTARKLSENTN
ncbi:hypothetical protein KBP51_13925 [Lactiplantibacillus pentosus]|uniref:hypothetical protein n=1 Tax=Lactiplantibacillus pentosus TaxID=1589 RepID=UPI001330B5C1|nr:hypothetical protein [Lactiplantibacillus pentosus]MBQ0837520.1 hypothetical protein [Lactiplantibacillus pentosus]